MDDLNAGRNDADHYDAEDLNVYPDEWEINDDIMQNFENALRNLKPFFERI